jgi:hypothetical protein
MDQNELKEKSPHADNPHTVFAKGTDDYPKGDCLKCESTWSLGGFAAEFKSKAEFKAARDKDPGVQSNFITCTKVWLEAHNSGRRCRPQSDKQRQRHGPNAIDKLLEVQALRKKVVAKRSRNLTVKIPMKVMTVERYKTRFGRAPEKDKLQPRWIGIPGGQIWGVSFRTLMDGEFDAEDSQVDGVEEEQELDDGQDVLREGQQEQFFNSAASELGSMSADAVYIAQTAAMADSDASAAEDGSDQGADGSEDSSHDAVARPRFMFCPKGLEELAREAAPRTAAKAIQPTKPRRGGAPAPPAGPATPRKGLPDHTGGSSSKSDPPTRAPSPSSAANDTDTELASISYGSLAEDFEKICHSLSHDAFKSIGILASDQKAICDQASEVCKELAKVFASICKAEVSSKRRKLFNENAALQLNTLKSDVNGFTKIFLSMKGSNI